MDPLKSEKIQLLASIRDSASQDVRAAGVVGVPPPVFPFARFEGTAGLEVQLQLKLIPVAGAAHLLVEVRVSRLDFEIVTADVEVHSHIGRLRSAWAENILAVDVLVAGRELDRRSRPIGDTRWP